MPKRQALKMEREASWPRVPEMSIDAFSSDFSKIAALICIPGNENPQKRQHRVRIAIGKAMLAAIGRSDCGAGGPSGMGRYPSGSYGSEKKLCGDGWICRANKAPNTLRNDDKFPIDRKKDSKWGIKIGFSLAG
jgi:hypothetical protein